MLLCKVVLLTTVAAAVVRGNSRAPQQTDLNTGQAKDQDKRYDLDDALARDQNELGISTLADLDDIEKTQLEKTELSNNPEKRILFDSWESIIEQNKSCTPTVSCSQAGGHCFASGSKCNGTVDAYGCIGGGRCMCCFPVTTSPNAVPTTIPTDKNCTPTVSCSQAGGHCFSSGSKCTGTVDAYGCISGGRCMCCFPVTTSAAPTTAVPTTMQTVPCDGDWTLVGSDCLQVFTEGKSSSSAAKKCKCIGGELAIPSSPDMLFNYLEKNYQNKNFWIGGTFSSVSGQFEFRPGFPVPEDWWASGHGKPTLASQKTNCVLGYMYYDSFKLWDWRCTGSYPFICQKFNPQTSGETTATTCKATVQIYNVGPQGMLFSHYICPELGRKRESLKDCKDRCSLNHKCNAFNYHPAECQLLECPIPIPEPTWYHGNGWIGYFIKTGPPTMCTGDWIPVGSDCLQVVASDADGGKSKDDADQYCKAIGGELAIPSTCDVDDWFEYLKENIDIRYVNLWIGGIFSTSTNTFEFRSGCSFPEDLWLDNEPSGSSIEYCVAGYITGYHGGTFGIKTVLCNTIHDFICQKFT